MIPRDVYKNVIFPLLELPDLVNAVRVCKEWNDLAKDERDRKNCQRFIAGPKVWQERFSCEVEDIPLSRKVVELFKEICPFTGAPLYKDYMIVLIPSRFKKEGQWCHLSGLTLETLVATYSTFIKHHYLYRNDDKYKAHNQKSFYVLWPMRKIQGDNLREIDSQRTKIMAINPSYTLPTPMIVHICFYLVCLKNIPNSNYNYQVISKGLSRSLNFSIDEEGEINSVGSTDNQQSANLPVRIL